MLHAVRVLCLTAVLAAGVAHSKSNNRPFGSSFGTPGVPATYDYVVVGGGTAGLTLASRLVQQNAGSVAVIEAGTFYEISNGNLSEVPSFAVSWAGKSPNDTQPMIDWGYDTTPQPGANNIPIHYPRGKALGGSSARNFMLYHRGTEGSFEKWADQVNDTSYTFASLLPYFEKSISFTPPNTKVRLQNATTVFSTTALGSGNGPLSVTMPNWVYAFPTWATKAFSQIGIPFRKEGLQNGGLLGHAYTMYTIDATSMTRSSSETAFLRPRLDNPNLYIYTSALAKRILFDGMKKATGIVVDTLGVEYTISARKEIILSAGFVGSPQLLQVSGVGPAQLLEALSIPVVADLPGVGQNLQDQIVFGVSQAINAITASSLSNAAFSAAAAQLFDNSATGLLTTLPGDMTAWERFPNSIRSTTLSNSTRAALDKYPTDWPDAEYIAFSGYMGDGNSLTAGDPADGKQYATLAVVQTKPQSRGSVNITSANTAVAPAIDPAYLSNPADIEIAVAGFKRARQFWASSTLNGFLVGGEAYPGPAVTTDAQILESIRGSFTTIYHGSCTCAMGKAGDSRAVVDTNARVYGVTGLRVVDAAAFPFLPPGHPQSIVYAFAEKIACHISGNCGK